MTVRLLTESDAETLWNFRRNALESEPQAFGESVNEHLRTSVADLAHRLKSDTGESFILGAFESATLIGMVGFHREQREKRRHKGHVWGVYVDASARSRGVGQALLRALISRARLLPDLRCILLSVATTQQHAWRLYSAAGFRPFGVEPRSLCAGDQFIDEEHMILELAPENGRRTNCGASVLRSRSPASEYLEASIHSDPPSNAFRRALKSRSTPPPPDSDPGGR